MTISHSTVALLCSSVLSILLCLIRITADSKPKFILSIANFPFSFFVIIMIVGNVFTTLIAISVIDNNLLSEDSSESLIGGPLWIWYSILGVFGFEALIKKINVTFFDQGVLSLNDWITTAKDTAIAKTIEKSVQLEVDEIQMLVSKLKDKLNTKDIHTLAQKQFTKLKYDEIVSSAVDSEEVDVVSLLAHNLADKYPAIVRATLKAHSP